MSGCEETRRALVEEFPGWLVTAAEDGLGVSWCAGRALTPGRGGVVGLHGDDPALLRELLREAEQCDARLALGALAAGLRAHGLEDVAVRDFDTNVIIQGPGEREWLIICRGGTFRWAMGGREIGPIADVPAAVRHVAGAVRVSPS